ncbi:LON peptidase substrate-binding domain-containing protein [Rubellicoccus peritrichatus]|uniref:LON peptidase substrate-binding domain-containing protein n=1 Tax=Rubellicoccus peritrichatus TaxID=3080537 RepID=A0AAQ3QTR4_9BACT|nr:LON peptidase substrate-binding domain-containing protein [Puniceicoccus sp. CR14]WOO39270.1 LON peptidase substrate-binding domain-containing protein [Puniceicoccus sp. CR14]
MSLSFTVPNEVPVMTLSGVVLFPQAMLPLHIFEPRYQQMLHDVLEGDRIFCVAGQNDLIAESTGQVEPPYEVASVGIVRASHHNDDGTSNLIIQGLVRVRFKKIVREEPYRVAEIEPLDSNPGGDSILLSQQKERLFKLLRTYDELGGNVPNEVMAFLSALEDPDAIVDLAAFALCNDGVEKQKLLENLNTSRRYSDYLEYLVLENNRLALEKKLRGTLGEDDIQLN